MVLASPHQLLVFKAEMSPSQSGSSHVLIHRPPAVPADSWATECLETTIDVYDIRTQLPQCKQLHSWIKTSVLDQKKKKSGFEIMWNQYTGLNCYTRRGLLARLALGWCLGTWILRRFPTLTDKTGLLCPNCLYKQRGLCSTPTLLLGVWNLGLFRAEAACVHNQNLGHWVSKEIWLASLSHAEFFA